MEDFFYYCWRNLENVWNPLSILEYSVEAKLRNKFSHSSFISAVQNINYHDVKLPFNIMNIIGEINLFSVFFIVMRSQNNDKGNTSVIKIIIKLGKQL